MEQERAGPASPLRAPPGVLHQVGESGVQGEREGLDAAKTAVEMHASLFGSILGAAWVACVGGGLELAFEGAILARVEPTGWYVRWRAIESGRKGTSCDLEEACLLAAKEAALHRCKQSRCG